MELSEDQFRLFHDSSRRIVKEEVFLITVNHLTKRYGNVLAVDDLSFTIEPGHIYGFLGPNGAGKSTTLNIMSGCLAATEGQVTINGFDIYENEKQAKKCIGYLPEIPPLYVEQTAREYLGFVAEAKGIRRADREDAIDAVVEETHIEEVQDRLIKNLSKGFRQRVGIAQALLGNPEVIILDEPTVGLDPMQIIEIRDLILELGKKHTVILSSHILSEVQAICEKVLIIYKGKLIAFDEPENLRKVLSSGNMIELIAETDMEGLLALTDQIEEVTKCELKEENDRYVKAVLYTEEDPYDLSRRVFLTFAANGKILLQINPVRTSLEDIFIELTRSEDEDQTDEMEISGDDQDTEAGISDQKQLLNEVRENRRAASLAYGRAATGDQADQLLSRSSSLKDGSPEQLLSENNFLEDIGAGDFATEDSATAEEKYDQAEEGRKE